MTVLQTPLAPHRLTHIDDAVTRNQSRMNAGLYHKRAQKADHVPHDILFNPLLDISDFPGKLSMNRLVQAGILTKLDAQTYYPSKYNATPVTRAHIAHSIIPYGTIASGWLAAWIWTGGDFPDRIDIASSTHYRSILFGRAVQSTSRQIHSSCVAQFPHCLVTTPTRTMCDIACSDLRRINSDELEHMLHRLSILYKVSERECIELMRTNTRQPRYTSGIDMLVHSFATREDNLAQCNALTNREDTSGVEDPSQITQENNDELYELLS